MSTNGIAAQALRKLCDGWTERAAEAVHALVHAGESRGAIRDACVFVGGSMVGQLLALQIPMEAVNAAGVRFFASCDEALRDHLPDYTPQGWPTMQTIQ